MLSRPQKVLMLVVLQLLSCWPVLRWYGLRTMDTSDAPWGLVALGSIILLLLSRKSPVVGKIDLTIPTSLLLAYGATYHYLPPLLRAVIAVSAIGCTVTYVFFGKRFQPGFCGLFLLALPVVPTMQFYLGYPLRVISGALTVPFLQLVGFSVFQEGAMLNWGGKVICIDAPCSGIKMLWAGFFLTFTLIAYYEISTTRSIIAIMGCLCIVIAANVLRSTALFFVESGIYQFPGWFHDGSGLVVFFLASVAITGSCIKLKRI